MRLHDSAVIQCVLLRYLQVSPLYRGVASNAGAWLNPYPYGCANSKALPLGAPPNKIGTRYRVREFFPRGFTLSVGYAATSPKGRGFFICSIMPQIGRENNIFMCVSRTVGDAGPYRL